jgi:mannose-1-phosphate guanylyltransferase
MKFIVTAGGQGTKIWPFSRKHKPKQFQKIINDESLFTYNVNVLLKQYPAKDIYISTKKQYIELVREQAPKIPKKNYIVEPNAAKNRGPGEGLAFLRLAIEHPKEPFMIVQSDDIRLPNDKYLEMIKHMEKLVKRDKKYITGGIQATYPIMGIDYIKLGRKVSIKDIDVYRVQEFIERNNDYKKTKKLINEAKVTTHSNHACWYPDLMLKEYKKYRPDWYEALMEIKKVLGTKNEEEKIEKIYENMEEGSTEEVTKHVMPEGYIVILPFKWVDIGTWNSVYEYIAKNGNNHTEGNTIVMESSGSLVKNVDEKKLIAILGVKDMIVVNTEDILLIAPRDKSGDIKELQKKLKEQNMEHYL